VRIGAREFGGAASADIVRAVTGLTSALGKFAGSQATAISNTDGPLTMVDLSTELTSVEDACTLDDSKIEMLLSASMIDPRDTKRYALLLGTARTSLMRKRDAMTLHEQRKTARLTHSPVVNLEDLRFDELAKSRLRVLYDKFEISNNPFIDSQYNRVMLMAITHDSYFNGRETNRVLAHMGDSVHKIMTAQYCFGHSRPVSDVSDMVQGTQTDVALAGLAKQHQLGEIVYVGHGVDVNAKKILATVVEAVVGAMYYLQGESPASRLSSAIGVVKTPDVTPTL